MRSRTTASLLAILVVGVAESGCSRSNHVQSESKSDEPATSESHSMHGHHHAFADPLERAKKWNDPARDQWQRPEEIVAALALQPGSTVADIGAGTGYMVAPLSQAVGPEGTVIAIDTSAEMVAFLGERSAELGPARVVPRQVNAHDPQFQAASLHGVLTLDTWHHIHGREAYAKKVFAGLRQGGRFVIVDYDLESPDGPPRQMRVGPSAVSKELAAAGFRVEIAQESMPRHFMVVGHKE